MAFAILIVAGWGLGIAMGALSHPVIYRAVFGGRGDSADHDRDWN